VLRWASQITGKGHINRVNIKKQIWEKRGEGGGGKTPPVYSCSQEWKTVWMNHPALSTFLSDTCRRINMYWRRAKM